MEKGVADSSVDDFYYLSRASAGEGRAPSRPVRPGLRPCLQGPRARRPRSSSPSFPRNGCASWPSSILTDEEKAQIEALGGWDKLMETLKQRLEEQKEPPPGRQQVDRHRRHLAVRRLRLQSRRRAHRPGREPRNGRAVKVWDKREFKNLDDTVELGTRNIKVALRRLRRFAREGAATSSTCDGTIRTTARKQGSLDIQMRPERHNTVKVLLFLDIGGSMDAHVKRVRGAVLGRAHRVQAPRVLLLPQLPLRARVEGQPPPPHRAHARPGRCCTPTATTTR